MISKFSMSLEKVRGGVLVRRRSSPPGWGMRSILPRRFVSLALVVIGKSAARIGANRLVRIPRINKCIARLCFVGQNVPRED